jgi:hypothetical protein
MSTSSPEIVEFATQITISLSDQACRSSFVCGACGDGSFALVMELLAQQHQRVLRLDRRRLLRSPGANGTSSPTSMFVQPFSATCR